MLRILMIAYYFPPDSSSGAFRPLFFANHLQKMGAEITVLTVKESDFLEEQPVSYDLLEKLDTCVDVVRAGAVRPRECLIALKNKMIKAENVRLTGNNGLRNGDAAPSFTRKVKDTITDLLTCPDPHVGWVPGAVKKGMAVIGEKNIDVIWATGSPWSCFVAGALLRKKTGKPLVMDFRDPWVANPNFARRGRIAACIERRLEGILVKNSNSIIANTEALRRDFIRRYPFLSGSVHTITNGFEAYVASSECRERRKRFSIVHAGAIYFNRNPKALLEAVYQLMAEERFDSDLFRMVFVGGISAADNAVSDILSHSLLEKVVRGIPRVSYDRAMEYGSPIISGVVIRVLLTDNTLPLSCNKIINGAIWELS